MFVTVSINDNERKLALKLFADDKYAELRKAIKNGEFFDTLAPLAEKAGALEHWDKFTDAWKYEMGCYPSVTDEMRREAFPKLEDERYIYFSGRDWQGVTDNMRIEAFAKLKDQRWICQAGCYWPGITDKMRREAFPKLKKVEYMFQACHIWSGVTNEMRQENSQVDMLCKLHLVKKR